MYLLDTNILSELRKAKGGKADKNVKVITKTYPVYDDFKEILGCSKSLLELVRFDYVDDKNNLHCNSSLAFLTKLPKGVAYIPSEKSTDFQ